MDKQPLPKDWRGGPPHWGDASPEWVARRRRFALRFAGMLILATLVLALLLAGLAILGFLLAGQGTLAIGRAELILLLACIAAPVLLVILFAGALVYRRVGSPLAEMMAAADAVAAGDFSARVREIGRGEMAALARRFNRMTAELERADRVRRNLTSDVAHELRTPLQIIQGNLEGVLDGVYAPTAEHLGATLDETRRLARLVGDLQTLSLAEAGELPLHRRPVAAADLLDDIVTRFLPQAAESGITLKAAVAGEPLLNADPDRLESVLANLTANALRHTPAGGRVALGGAATAAGVVLTVADSGEGIPAADLPYVFDRFWRGDRARHRAEGNTGLGLAIARQLVVAHGGTIAVDSKPGVGTTFTITLPSG